MNHLHCKNEYPVSGNRFPKVMVTFSCMIVNKKFFLADLSQYLDNINVVRDKGGFLENRTAYPISTHNPYAVAKSGLNDPPAAAGEFIILYMISACFLES